MERYRFNLGSTIWFKDIVATNTARNHNGKPHGRRASVPAAGWAMVAAAAALTAAA